MGGGGGGEVNGEKEEGKTEAYVSAPHCQW